MGDQGIRIGTDGYFMRGGGRLVPIGANYWAGSCGGRMWREWPAEEIQRDLDLLAHHGFNTIRFFLRWQDFEPMPGKYDEQVFGRLSQLLEWCGERGVSAQPVLFVPFAGGAAAGPAWRQGRNYFTDDFMRQRAVEFAFKSARIVARYESQVLGIDVGHQLCRLPDCQSAVPAMVKSWAHDVIAAIRGGFPKALIVTGNGTEQITRDTGWRLGELAGADYYAMHGSTLPAMHPVAFDGLTDPFGHSLLPLYLEMARSFGPVMLQDLAIEPAGGAKQQDEYLRAVLSACWNAGANGFLWTSLRDIQTDWPGDSTQCATGTLGLLDEAGNIKKGLEFFREFSQSLAEANRPRVSGQYVGLYFPSNYYPRDNPKNADNDPNEVMRSLATANHHLRHAGHEVHIVRGDRPINPRTKTIFVTGSNLSNEEAEAMIAWVEAGGKLIWHGPDPMNWGPVYQRLLGAFPVDYRRGGDAVIAWGGGEWKIGQFPRNIRAEVTLSGANVLAIDDSEWPAVLRHSLGKGTVTYAMAMIEQAIARGNLPRADRDRCTQWYQAMLQV